MTQPAHENEKRPSRLRRWLRWAVAAMGVCAVLVVAALVGVPLYLEGPTVRGSGSGTLQAAELNQPGPRPAELTVMTLNLAHGRAEKSHQALLRKATIAKHLDAVADVLREVSPHVVALQEADGPSLWSGRFDHVARVAEKAGFEHSFRGEHVRGMKLSYGTALLSEYDLENTASITFPPSPPTWTKGVVVGEVQVPGIGLVTVASVHLDFAQQSARKQQAERLVAELKDRSRPLIVLGDFNCDWDDESTLPDVAEGLGLHAYAPEEETVTFPKLGKRLDWILVSDELEFVDCDVLSEPISDHRAVTATLRLAERP